MAHDAYKLCMSQQNIMATVERVVETSQNSSSHASWSYTSTCCAKFDYMQTCNTKQTIEIINGLLWVSVGHIIKFVNLNGNETVMILVYVISSSFWTLSEWPSKLAVWVKFSENSVSSM